MFNIHTHRKRSRFTSWLRSPKKDIIELWKIKFAVWIQTKTGLIRFTATMSSTISSLIWCNKIYGKLITHNSLPDVRWKVKTPRARGDSEKVVLHWCGSGSDTDRAFESITLHDYHQSTTSLNFFSASYAYKSILRYYLYTSAIWFRDYIMSNRMCPSATFWHGVSSMLENEYADNLVAKKNDMKHSRSNE